MSPALPALPVRHFDRPITPDSACETNKKGETFVVGSGSGLTETEVMKPTRKLSRRSFMATVAGGVAGAGALLIVAQPAKAIQTDTDSGPNADPLGGGNRHVSVTDKDIGPHSDQSIPARGGVSGITDNESGRQADPGNNGRGPRAVRRRGITDRDSGRYADPAGLNRGRRSVHRRACTDSDTGRYADRVSHGDHC
jgi:hypothetical protein